VARSKSHNEIAQRRDRRRSGLHDNIRPAGTTNRSIRQQWS